MKPLIYEPKCIIYEYKSSLFTFYALSLLFFSTAKVIRISQPRNKKDTFSCIFIVQAFAQTTSHCSFLLPYTLLYITEEDKDDNTLFGFYQYTKAKWKQSNAQNYTTTQNSKYRISFYHVRRHITYNLQANEALVLTIWNRTKKYRLFSQIIACIFRQIVVLLQSKSNK